MKGTLIMFLLSLAVFSGCASTQDDSRADTRYEKSDGSGHRH